MNNLEHYLLGKHIKSVHVDSNKDFITFVATDGSYRFEAVGDCCSSSWIEHLNNVDALNGHTIVSIAEHPTEDLSENDDESIQVYRISINTKAGTCDLEFRNSSNGYYGGYLQYVKSTDDHKKSSEDF